MGRWAKTTHAFVVAAAVLLTGVPASLGVAVLLARQVDATTRSQFNRIAEQVGSEFYAWAFRPVYGMNGLRGTYAASDTVTEGEFRDYYLSRDLPAEFPGMQNIGFAVRSNAESSPGVGEGDDALWPIRFMEPQERYGGAVGTDLASDERMRRALERAVEGNETLLLSARDTAAADPTMHLWVVPVYRNGLPKATAQQRREAIHGVILAQFRVEDLASRLEAELDGMAELRISKLASDTGDSWLQLLRCGDTAVSDGHWLSRTDVVSVGGASIALDVRPTPAFLNARRSAAPTVVAVCGIVLTCTLATLLISLSRSRQRAVQLARSKDGEVRRLSLVARYTSNVVIITDRDQHIIWVNDAFTHLTGYSAEEALGRRPGDLLQCPDTSEETRRAIREALQRGSGYQGEILNVSKDGQPYWVRLDIQPVRDGRGKITEFVAVESDLTQQKEQQRRLREAVRAAEHASESKSRFLSGMSHEIRTPLNGIIGFADLLRRNAHEGDESLKAEWIGVIHGSAQHLLALLNDVLDLSKLDAEQMDIALAPCNPHSVIAGAAYLLQSRAREKDVALDVRVDEPVPTGVRTDATRLRQIVMNLVSNAVKFTDHGAVSVDVSMSGPVQGAPRLRVDVRDTGIGIVPEKVERLFKPFQQADHTIAEEFGGTGLGLSISRALAVRLGGDITVSSTPGVGSCFTLEIDAPPLLPGESLPEGGVVGHAEQPGDVGRVLDGCRILVVDDVAANRDVARIMLQRAGAEVTTAENGEDAVSRVEQAGFDLILMDVQMPRMNGMEATRRLRELGCKAPVLALTAFSSGADRSQCLEAGMDDFLAKPFEPTVLLQTSARWIRSKQAGTGELPTIESLDADMLEIAQEWLAGVPGRLGEASEALDRGDTAAAAAIAHTIKGSGGTLGFPEFTDPSIRLEAACKAGDSEGARAEIERLRSLHRDLTARLAERSAA